MAMRRILLTFMKTRLMLPGLLPALLLASSHWLPAQATLPLYLDTLENTFQNWSWIENNFESTTYLLPGFTDSISATATGSWQAISLGTDVVNAYQGMNISPYQNLVFWANGGSAGGQKLQVFPGNFTGAGVGAAYALPALTAGTWTQFSIPLSTICPAGTTNIDRFSFQLTTSGTTGTWYLGDIYFTPKTAPALVNLSVDASQTIRTADPRWFGVNTAIWDGYLDTSYTSNALTQAGLLSLRFPGGSLSDEYNWVTGKTTAYTTNGTAGTVSSYACNFGNFMHVFTNRPGEQAFITVNYGSGTSNQAAAWVLNANVTNHCGIKYWEVGNECYGTWETDTNSPPWSAHTYATRFAGYYALMKAADTNIKVGAVCVPGEDSSANYTTYAATNPATGQVHYGWTPVLLSTLKSLGVTPDFLIYHFYPEYSPQGDSDQLVLQVSSQLAQDATNLRYMLTEYLGPSSSNTELCITENNGETDGKQSTSLVNGLYVADTMGQVMKTEFNAYTFWDLRNGQDTSGNYDSTLYGWRTVGDNGCIYNQSSCYPSYYGLSMMQYLARPGSTTLNASSSYLLLTPYAARAADGSLRLLVINKDTNATFNGQVNLANFVPSSTATVYFYGQPQDNAAKNNLSLSLQQIAVSNYSPVSTQFTYAFPPLSLTLFNFAPLQTTTVNLTSSANPSIYGNPITFTATVQSNGVAAGGISGESVAFYNGAVQIGAGTLNASAQAGYTTAATQLAAGLSSITAVYSGDAVYAASTNSPALSQTINQATPIITWANPAPITYGTALSSGQLDATANVPGNSFAYAPTNGAVLNAGANTLSVIFTPTDQGDYTGATNTVSLLVSSAPLTVTASNASRVYGLANPAFTGAIAGLQNGDNITAACSCNATDSSPVGTYPITPLLSDPNNRLANYTVTTNIGTLTITLAASFLSWPTPSAVNYGTPLSSNQLDATANVPGSFAYNPSAGTVLSPGTNMLGLLFTPDDAIDYSNATNSVSLLVLLAPIDLNIQLAGSNVVLSWNDPASLFSLQSAPDLTGIFTNVPGTSSPYTNAITGQQQFFQLVAPAN